MVRYYFIVMTLPKHKRLIDHSLVIQVPSNPATLGECRFGAVLPALQALSTLFDGRKVACVGTGVKLSWTADSIRI
jgi:hypothetical protein